MRILYVKMIYPAPEREADFTGKKEEDTEMINRKVSGGTETVECRFDSTLAGYHILKEVVKAKDEGVKFDAVRIGCMSDPAADELRELLDVPVTGPLRTAIHLASLLANKFSIVTLNEYSVPAQRELVLKYGFGNKLASVRHISSSVKELHEHIEEPYLTEKFVSVAKKCIEEDGAEAIIPGCGGFSPIAENLVKALAPYIYIDTTEAEIRMLELLHKMGLKQSKKSYPNISPKKRTL